MPKVDGGEGSTSARSEAHSQVDRELVVIDVEPAVVPDFLPKEPEVQPDEEAAVEEPVDPEVQVRPVVVVRIVVVGKGRGP